MIAWLMSSAAAAWILVAIAVLATGSTSFLANAFWGLILVGIGVYTIMLHMAEASTANILLLIYAGVAVPTRLLIGR